MRDPASPPPPTKISTSPISPAASSLTFFPVPITTHPSSSPFSASLLSSPFLSSPSYPSFYPLDTPNPPIPYPSHHNGCQRLNLRPLGDSQGGMSLMSCTFLTSP